MPRIDDLANLKRSTEKIKVGSGKLPARLKTPLHEAAQVCWILKALSSLCPPSGFIGPWPWLEAENLADSLVDLLCPEGANIEASATLRKSVRVELAALAPRYVCRRAVAIGVAGLLPEELARLCLRALRRVGAAELVSPDSAWDIAPIESFDSKLQHTATNDKGPALKLQSPRLTSSDGQKGYELGQKLRAGRLGVVRRCHLVEESEKQVVTDDTRMGYVCRSVMRIFVSLGHRGKPVGRVQDDLDILKDLQHPHVAQLRWFFEDSEHLHLVFDHIQGADLRLALAQGSKGHGISESWIGACMMQLALGLAYCHSRRVIHRNLTLRKVMLRAWSGWSAGSPDVPPHVMVLDAGLAEALVPAHDKRQAERPFGRPAFMAPEVFRRQYGPGCDVWSLGVLAHVLLTGCLPSPGISETGNPEIVVSRVSSSDAAAFCARLFTQDEALRPRAEEVAKSTWLESARSRLVVLHQRLYCSFAEREE